MFCVSQETVPQLAGFLRKRSTLQPVIFESSVADLASVGLSLFQFWNNSISLQAPKQAERDGYTLSGHRLHRVVTRPSHPMKTTSSIAHGEFPIS